MDVEDETSQFLSAYGSGYFRDGPFLYSWQGEFVETNVIVVSV
jgi:hypothetical protein